MLPLLAFILSSSSLFLIFRGMDKRRDALQVLLFNYLFCTFFSTIDYIISPGIVGQKINSIPDWAPFAAGLGVLYLINFSLTEKTVRICGAAVSSVATKLSLVLPFFYTLMLKGEMPSIQSLAGLFLCILAIILASERSKNNSTIGEGPGWFLPLLIFLGTGFTDVLTQWLNQTMVPPSQGPLMVLVVFAFAFLSSSLMLVLKLSRKKSQFQFSTVWPGFLLGLPNFISYKSILAALSAFHHQGNVVFPMANLGVILLTSMASILYFRDQAGGRKLAGILLALIALTFFFQKD